MSSEIQCQSIIDMNADYKSNTNAIIHKVSSLKNINNNENKENVKIFNDEKLTDNFEKDNSAYDNTKMNNITSSSIQNIKTEKRKSFEVSYDSESTLVKSSDNLYQFNTIKPFSNEEEKETFNNNNKDNTNYNDIKEIVEEKEKVKIEDNSYSNDSDIIDRKKTITQEDVLKEKPYKHNSTSSFKTAFSYSTESSVNTFQTGKTSVSEQAFENKISDSSLKDTQVSTNSIVPKIILTTKTDTTNSTKTIKIYHPQKEQGNELNVSNSTASISKRYKSRNISKDFVNVNHLLPNHLMLNENNSKASFKKDDVQKLSISSLSIKKSHSLKKQSKAIENIIGTPIKKDHVHYILMLDMLNGIRYSVCIFYFL